METKRQKLPIFPAWMTAAALAGFAAAYGLVTRGFLVPQYGRGLLFALPFLVLLALTLCSRFGCCAEERANKLTVVITALSLLAAFPLYLWMAFCQGEGMDELRLYPPHLCPHGGGKLLRRPAAAHPPGAGGYGLLLCACPFAERRGVCPAASGGCFFPGRLRNGTGGAGPVEGHLGAGSRRKPNRAG